MPKVQMLVLLCASAAAVLAMHHADWRSCEWTQKQGGHLAAPEGVAISLRAATMLLLFPSRALTACISPSSLAMPCKRHIMFSCNLQLHSAADALQGMLCSVALFSRCPARHARFSCTLQQLPCKACYIQLQSSADAPQGILGSVAVFSRWARDRRNAWRSKLMLEDDAERVLGILLDFSINALLIVTAASHLYSQDLLHASLMPTAEIE